MMPMKKLGYLIAALLALSAMGAAWSAWRSMAEVDMGVPGVVAMILGAVGVFALGGGLLGLIFISHRKGFDDRAGAPPGRRGEFPDS